VATSVTDAAVFRHAEVALSVVVGDAVSDRAQDVEGVHGDRAATGRDAFGAGALDLQGMGRVVKPAL
jgi:hypothetical protein